MCPEVVFPGGNIPLTEFRLVIRLPWWSFLWDVSHVAELSIIPVLRSAASKVKKLAKRECWTSPQPLWTLRSSHSIFLMILKGLSFVLCSVGLGRGGGLFSLNMIRNWAGQSGSSGWWLVDRMPWNAVGLKPRIQHFVFVCFWETVVWCYCDRKWESWEWGNGEGRCLCGSPVKSLCPWRAALLQGSTEKRAAFVCLMGLRASSYSEGLGSVNSDCGLLRFSTWVI